MDINSNGFNTYLNDFKNDLVNTVNKSGLPVGVAYYIIKDLFMEIQSAYEATLKSEKEMALINNVEKVEEVHDDIKKNKSTCKKSEK